MLHKKDLPRVALETMNRVHQEELTQVNALYVALSAWRSGYSSGHHGVDVALRTLVHHMREHFADEEAHMRASAFPAYSAHRVDHARALATVEAVEAVWLSERDPMPLWTYLDIILPRWMVQHVREMDAAMAQHIVTRESAGGSLKKGAATGVADLTDRSRL